MARADGIIRRIYRIRVGENLIRELRDRKRLAKHSYCITKPASTHDEIQTLVVRITWFILAGEPSHKAIRRSSQA